MRLMRKVPQAPRIAAQDMTPLKCQAITAGRVIHAIDAKGATGTPACFARIDDTMKCQASTAGRIIHAIDAKSVTGTQGLLCKT